MAVSRGSIAGPVVGIVGPGPGEEDSNLIVGTTTITGGVNGYFLYDNNGVLGVTPAVSFANPTASVGLTAVNGVLGTAMRSDAAPALSQAIIPTWTGLHTFSNGVRANTVAIGGATIGTDVLAATGTATISSTVTGGTFVPTLNTIPTDGMYLNAAGQIAFAAGSTRIFFANSAGLLMANAAGATLTSIAATATAPTVVPRRSDSGTGIGSPSTASLSLIASSVEQLRVNNGSIVAYVASAIPAGGTAGLGYSFSSTSNFGVFFGSGAPTLSAAQGSIYLRSDGSPSYNTNGSTGWSTIGVGTVTSVALTMPTVFTVGGSPITSSGTLAVTANGTSGGVPYFDSATTMASSAALTANRLVLGGGAGAAPTILGSLGTTSTVLHGNAAGAPTFSAVSLTADVTGTLVVANGGTGIATATAYGVVCAGTTATGAWQVLASLGTSGQVLTSGGAGALPTWTTIGGTGTVTSIDVSGGTTGLTTSGGPITTNGTITLAGTLIVANGGTGRTSLTNHGVLVGAGTSAITQLAAAGAGTILGGVAASDPAFTATPVLGIAGSVLGTIGFQNATSGTITLSPVAGALGTVTLTLPAATDTVAVLAAAQALTNKTYNGLNVTSTTGTLTVTNAKTLAISNSLTLAGTDGTTMTFPGTSSTVLTTGNTATITKGYTLTPNSLGNMTNFTIDPSLGNYQYGTNHAAFTLTAPTSDCAIDLLVTNDASAGAITFSGFTVGASTGSALTTTNTNKFIISIRRINSVATYSVYALQ